MFCDQCGAKAETTAKFCQACGSPLPADSHRKIQPVFTGHGSDIFSVKGLRMLLWYASIVGIPVGWTYTVRWVLENIELSGGPKLSFRGRAAEAYVYFLLTAVFSVLNRQDPTTWDVLRGLEPPLLGLIVLAMWICLLATQGLVYWNLYRWVCTNVSLSSGSTLMFHGGVWRYIGWTILQVLSIFTVVGWAWVQTAFLRWQLGQTRTSGTQLQFRGSGFGVLWRTVGATAACILIVPIPWVVTYMIGWYLANIELSAVDMARVTA